MWWNPDFGYSRLEPEGMNTADAIGAPAAEREMACSETDTVVL
jgi:hypothetical protein